MLLHSVQAAAMEEFEVPDDDVWVFWYGGFGYVVISDGYVKELGALAQMAETGEPFD